MCVAGATCERVNDSSTGQCTCDSGVSKRNGDICGKSHAVRSVPGSVLGLSTMGAGIAQWLKRRTRD